MNGPINFLSPESILGLWGVSSGQFSPSVMSNSATPWAAARPASLSITNSQNLFKLMSMKSVMPSNHLMPCHPLLLMPSIHSTIRVFSNESVLCIRWPKYWSFSFSISPFNEYLGLISFRMDWLDLLAVQGITKSLLQHYTSKASILWRSAFFIVQLSHPYQRRWWHPTPVLLPGESCGHRRLVGCSPWGRKESDTTERLHFHFSLSCIGEGNGNPLQCSFLKNPRDRGAATAAAHPYMTTGKTIALTSWIFSGKIMCHLIAHWELQLRIAAKKTKRKKQKFSQKKFQNSLEFTPPFSLSLSPSPHLP